MNIYNRTSDDNIRPVQPSLPRVYQCISFITIMKRNEWYQKNERRETVSKKDTIKTL